MTDPFRHDDGAYVLDALSPDESVAFEAHLATCADCQARVAESRAAVSLLSGLTEADIADPGPMPDTLLPGLLRRASREHSRRRVISGSIAVVAAACITALVVVLWPGSSNSPAAPTQALVPVRPSPVTATATLVSKAWGTEIDLNCRYSDNVERWEPYRLVVVDDAGGKHEAGSWTLGAGHEVTFTGGTAVPQQEIARVEITLDDGSPILELKV
jgi:anti-sigma factor RsiW